MKGFVDEPNYTIDLLEEGTTLRDVIDNHIYEQALVEKNAFFVADLGNVVKKHIQWQNVMAQIKPFYTVKCNTSTALIEILAALGIGFACASKVEKNAFFVADLGNVVKKHIQWQNVMAQIKPFYTVKCNTSTALIEILAALGIGFACASKNEIALVQSFGVAPENIIYTSMCKQLSQIKYAAKNGIDILVCDNETELMKIARNHPSAKLLLHIATEASSEGEEMSMDFGSKLKNCRHLLECAKELGVEVVGVKFHISSSCKDLQAYTHAVSDARCIFDMGAEFGFNMSILDIGGGFSGAEFLLEEIYSAVSPLLDIYFPPESGVSVIAEPGSYYVASSFTLAVNYFFSYDVLLLHIATEASSEGEEMSMDFGSKLKNCRHLLECAKELGVEVVGVKFHISSSCKDLQAYTHAVSDARCIFDMGAEFGFNMSILDIGGGFSGAEFLLEEIYSAVSPLLDIYFPPESGVSVIAEPGSYYVASSFTLAVNIIAKKAEFGFNMSILDIGGGFSGAEFQLEEIYSAISPLLDIYFPPESGVSVIAEPGSYYVASSFTLAVNIIAKKVVARDQNKELEPSPNDEPAYMYYMNDGVYGSFASKLTDNTIAVPSVHKKYSKEEAVFASSLWGPSSDGLDQVIEHCLLPELNVGDWVTFDNMGANTLGEQSAFNDFQKPPVYYLISAFDWYEMQDAGITLDTTMKNFFFVPSCFQASQEDRISAPA
ncbi:UNVERIFIED_CONTAM: hypothetical protein FKN15_056434 [Acipenser sinensis]